MTKQFRDPIYGYINIPKEYVEEFIDTTIFQRLRRIEQTSMRVLYPTAHHDRFSHSLGVYFLGRMAFQNIEKNSRSRYTDVDWNVYSKSFEIACLLHDCGHSPFSHTFEKQYIEGRQSEIEGRILNKFDDENFAIDWENCSPAPHEMISALVVLEYYNESINRLGGNACLVARMIMGCKHYHADSTKKKIENVIITLLNGTGIDVDSLDYIQRDSWASGTSNVNIDYNRLLASIQICEHDGSLKLAFGKQVLSVVDNVLNGRNFLYKWIYSHHKVNYEQSLLAHIVNQLSADIRKKIFSIDAFFDIQHHDGEIIFAPTDDDVIHLVKKFTHGSEILNEFLSHKHKYKAAWKTFFEFNEIYCVGYSNDEKMKIKRKLDAGVLADKYGVDWVKCIEVKPKIKAFPVGVIYIRAENSLVDITNISALRNEDLYYFIPYIKTELLPRKDEIIQDIKQLRN